MAAEDRYRPISARRRLLILLLAIATAVTVVLTLLYPPGGVKRTRPVAPDAARCSEGRSTDCVGGKAEVIVVPPSAPVAASAPG